MIAAYHGTSWLSRRIIKFTRSPLGISYVGWVDHDWSVWEAWTRGGLLHNASLWSVHTPGTIVDLFDVDGLTDAQRLLVADWFERHEGAPYDFASIFGFITRKFMDGNPSGLFCSEAVYAALEYAGRPLLRSTEPAPTEAWQVDPSMLLRSPLLKWVGTFDHPENLQAITHQHG